MRCRHLIALVLAALSIFTVLELFPRSLPAEQVGQAGGAKQCVGIATSVLRTANPVITRVYRVFNDGSVEAFDDGAPGAKWTALGR